jgi:hypothetical protein
MIIRARSYTDLISFLGQFFRRSRILLWTAELSGLFLPNLLGKLVIIVSIDVFSPLRSKVVVLQ